MYKIFFKDRVVFLTDRIDDDLTNDFGAIHKLGSEGELKKFINNFEKNENNKEAFIYHHNKYVLLQKFRSCFKNLLAAGGLVWDSKKENFLTLIRLGRADLPKGKVEKNETFEQTAIREVTEECGIEPPDIIKPLGMTFHTYHLGVEHILKETHWFEMIYKGNSVAIPQKEENITEISWLPALQAKKFAKRTYPSIREIIYNAGLI
jgi:8-oxo-dGTP pyrophosphatase MutT (NUDIX family)